MNRIRNSIHALFSRSKKDLRSDVAVVKSRQSQEEEQSYPAFQSGRAVRKNSAASTSTSTSSTTSAGFNVFQARIYTKGARNDYHYSPVPVIVLPTFQIDPPDDIPFHLSITEEQEEYQSCVVAPLRISSSAKDETRKPPLTIDTGQAIISKSAPPTPPSSPGVQAAQETSPTSIYEYESPTRAPPSPPITPRLGPYSPFLDASDDILINVFSHLDSLPAMESLSLAHPRLHSILVSNKLFILRGILHNVSPPASDLVESLKPSGTHTAKSYMENYTSSLEVVHAIKALIQTRCRFFLTSGKMDFFNDGAERAFDNALFSIWGFCMTFRDRRESGGSQMAWLRRFGSSEILDILEIWQCLGVLLRPLADSPELARKHGIIQNPPPSNDSEVISELGQDPLLR